MKRCRRCPEHRLERAVRAIRAASKECARRRKEERAARGLRRVYVHLGTGEVVHLRLAAKLLGVHAATLSRALRAAGGGRQGKLRVELGDGSPPRVTRAGHG